MTYTEQDLRAVLGALESDAPDVADTLAGVDRLRRRRTTRRRAVAVAAVTVVLAVGAVSVPSLVRSNEQQPASVGAGNGLNYRFAIDDIPGTQVHLGFLNPTREQASIPRPGEYPIMIDVFARGGYEPGPALRNGEQVDVNGKRGYYLAELPCQCASDPPGPGVAWEYEPDSWALVHLQSPRRIDREELLRVARAMRFDRTTPVRVPYKVGYLPAGLRLTQGSTTTLGPGEPSQMLVLSAADGTTLHVELDASRPGAGKRPEQGPGYAEIDLGAFSVILRTGLFHSAPHGYTPPKVSDEDLRKIAESITVAGEWHDPNTWLETDKAFPTT